MSSKPMNTTEIKDMVRARYGGIAAGTAASCGPATGSSCCDPSDASTQDRGDARWRGCRRSRQRRRI